MKPPRTHDIIATGSTKNHRRLKKGSYPQMAYSDQKREEVIDLYESGMPRGEIAKKEGISLSTIGYWTQETVSAPLSFLTCPHCKKRKRRSNIQQKYCSKPCKNAAAYRRSVQHGDGTATPPQQCSLCGRRYTPKHGNALIYCSKRCRTAASNQRRKAKSDLIAAEQAAEQAHIEAKQQDIDHCIKTLQQARRANLETSTISRSRYSAEIETISLFIRQGNPTPGQWNAIQDLIKSVR